MAEGLNPIEVGKKLHEHGEAEEAEEAEEGQEAQEAHQAREAHEAQEHAERQAETRGRDNSHHSRIVQICEAVLLALVTIAAAWAGYSAARWNTTSRVDIARSATLRNIATRDDITALELRNFDSATFNAWYIAFTLNNPAKERIAERRFRPAFRVAFNAWLATDPVRNPHAPPGPTYMRQYKLPAQARANALDAAATAKFNHGNYAGNVGDNYVRITVFLAAVLFLVGIGSSFKLPSIRYALITFGTLLLIVSVVLIIRQPGLPSG
jgi:hypothetical protein